MENLNNINTSLIAINKFFYFSMNYPMVNITYEDFNGETKTDYLPSFFKVFSPHMICHLRDKWITAINRTNYYGYLFSFYAELDIENRQKLLTYVMENYNGEYNILPPTE